MGSLCQIEIRRLKVRCHIGVPEEERTLPQELLLSVKLGVASDFGTMEDDISRTVDYAALAERLRELAAARPRKLIETLAAEAGEMVLAVPGVTSVEIVLEKFILPETECVAVHWHRCLTDGMDHGLQ